MRLLIALLTFGLVVAGFEQAGAAVNKRATAKSGKKAGKAKASKKVANGDLGTNHNFDDHGVIGEYQVPDEALAKVENEKLLSDLLGVRKHFKDRLLEASEQE